MASLSLPGHGGTEVQQSGSSASLRFIDWIWVVRGSVDLAPAQSSDEAFARLDPLFRENGTTHERSGDTLVFEKKGAGAQDKMSVFDHGVLRVEQGETVPVLRYHLVSRALLFCFLAPLLFLAFAQLNVALGKFDKPSTEEAGAKKDKKDKVLALNPVDKFLGAPAPEQKKDKDKEKDKDKDKGKNKHSPTPAYVFAGIFALLYLVGRVLEDWLIKRLFEKRLTGA